ncbi:YndM family protein [Salicibibacter cibarius]|uniref:YndM family protein n=1 Tax=Salicibibacter cibarius TaxID=2743000 RepID=A0A7T6Z4U3_9BACI|nr:YndM family protein [Salicibibacter cibarius]QQK76891.1 YndM family protein [Salicibibacter cibarius]
MKYFAGIGIKFGMMLVVIWVVLGGFFDVAFSNVLAISLILTVVSFLGDVFILPGIKDVTAIIADFFLAWAGVWILGFFFIEQPMALGIPSFIVALILTGSEIFFHMYMRRRFFNSPSGDEENQSTAPPEPENEQQRSSVRDLQTEYGEDMYAKLSAKDPKSKKQQ